CRPGVGRAAWACWGGRPMKPQLGFTLMAALTWGAPVWAQDGDANDAPAPAAEAAPAPGGQTVVTGSYLPPIITRSNPPVDFNVDAHLPSSSQSKLDINQGDTFDFRQGQGGVTVMRGSKGAPGIIAHETKGSTGRSEERSVGRA